MKGKLVENKKAHWVSEELVSWILIIGLIGAVIAGLILIFTRAGG